MLIWAKIWTRNVGFRLTAASRSLAKKWAKVCTLLSIYMIETYRNKLDINGNSGSNKSQLIIALKYLKITLNLDELIES